VRWAQFEHVGVFRYSDEETSGSAKLEGKVTAQVAQRRYRKLMSLQRGIARAKNKQLIGKTLEVLVEGTSEEHEFVMKGRHRGQAPDIDGQVYLSEGEAAAGQIRQVRIDQASDYDLVGALMDEAPSAPKKRRVGLRVLPA
jgi:ribosomal protein S12 methylthiotransferase